jgi:hypothetical protein
MPSIPPVRPHIVVQGMGGGLLLMAFFTMMWAGVAQGGLQGPDHYIHLAELLASSSSWAFLVSGYLLPS